VMCGLFFHELRNVVSVGASKGAAMAAGLVAVVIVGYMTKNEIRISARLTAIFIAIEAGFVALFAIYITIKQAAIAVHLEAPMLNTLSSELKNSPNITGMRIVPTV